jgi:hippurate hydrolase
MPDGYPCVVNDQQITEKAREFAIDWIGKGNVVPLEVRMTSEDFGFFTQKYPSTFYRFGVKGDANANTGGLHSATFQIDEKALEIGVGGMSWLTWRFLNE